MAANCILSALWEGLTAFQTSTVSVVEGWVGELSKARSHGQLLTVLSEVRGGEAEFGQDKLHLEPASMVPFSQP